MANRNHSVILFSLLVLTAIFISACTQPYSTVSLDETPAAAETSLFVSPFPTSDNPMAMVEELSTGTALAETAAALNSDDGSRDETNGQKCNELNHTIYIHPKRHYRLSKMDQCCFPSM